MRAVLQPFFDSAIDARVTPGAVLAIDDRGAEVATLAFGLTASRDDGGVPVERDTIYDIASVTKMVSTASLLAILLADGALELDTPARDLLPELRGDGTDAITVRHLAGHGAGFPAHIEFFRRLRDGDRAGAPTAREALVRMAATTPLAYRPGERTIYSDLGYIVLGAALERVGGARLDQLFAARIATPLGLSQTFFVDTEAGARAPTAATIAPTERCPVRGLVCGEVHDDNAHAGGGVCGHAGLFSTVDDLRTIARALCAAADGEDSGPFRADAVRALTLGQAAPDTLKRLGFDVPDPTPGASHAGDLWPRSGVGHLGFTGTSLWLDPPRRRSVILLANRVYCSRDKDGIKSLRRAVMDAISRHLPG